MKQTNLTNGEIDEINKRVARKVEPPSGEVSALALIGWAAVVSLIGLFLLA